MRTNLITIRGYWNIGLAATLLCPAFYHFLGMNLNQAVWGWVIAAGVYPAEISARKALGRLNSLPPGIYCRLSLTTWREVAELLQSRSIDLGIAK